MQGSHLRYIWKKTRSDLRFAGVLGVEHLAG